MEKVNERRSLTDRYPTNFLGKAKDQLLPAEWCAPQVDNSPDVEGSARQELWLATWRLRVLYRRSGRLP